MMKITEVRLYVVSVKSDKDKLRAYVNITLDDSLIIRDIRLISGTEGMFVTMPDRKLTEHCPQCNAKNPIGSNFCNRCGVRLEQHIPFVNGSRKKFFADIIHPITVTFRKYLTQQVLLAYQENMKGQAQSGITRFCNNRVVEFTEVEAEALTPFGYGL